MERFSPPVLLLAPCLDQPDGVTRAYRAREVSPEEKAVLWPVIVDAYPPYDEYQARTDRNIPVFVCDVAS